MDQGGRKPRASPRLPSTGCPHLCSAWLQSVGPGPWGPRVISVPLPWFRTSLLKRPHLPLPGGCLRRWVPLRTHSQGPRCLGRGVCPQGSSGAPAVGAGPLGAPFGDTCPSWLPHPTPSVISPGNKPLISHIHTNSPLRASFWGSRTKMILSAILTNVLQSGGDPMRKAT